MCVPLYTNIVCVCLYSASKSFTCDPSECACCAIFRRFEPWWPFLRLLKLFIHFCLSGTRFVLQNPSKQSVWTSEWCFIIWRFSLLCCRYCIWFYFLFLDTVCVALIWLSWLTGRKEPIIYLSPNKDCEKSETEEGLWLVIRCIVLRPGLV